MKLTIYVCAIVACLVGSSPVVSQADDASTAPSKRKLFSAVASGDKEALLELLESGVDINGKSPQGLTAWEVARRSGYDELADLLKSKGATTDTPAPSVAELVDRGIGRVFSEDKPGCAILVSRNGDVLFEKVFGNANIEQNIPVEPNTKFRIGSVSKQFTAAAILKLQEDGKLSVGDKLSKYIPDYPRGNEVTIHHLLTHTSGIKSYTGKPDFVKTMTEPTTEIDLINSFKNDPYDFDPGDRYSYNNSGYFLLGHIIGIVSESSYADYLDTTFFKPLKMTDSGVHSPELDLDHEATGYAIRDEATDLAPDWHMSRAGGAGAIYSTLRDLYKWNEAVFDRRVLTQESLDAAFSPTKLNDGNTTDYGYGWAIGNHRGLRTINHSGGLDGFLSYLARYPAQKTTIVVFTNVFPNGDLPAPAEIASRLGEHLLWKEMEKRVVKVVDSSVDPKSFQDFVGIYDYGSPILMEVTLEDEQLYAQLTGQPKFPIYALNADTFFWRVVDAEVQFARDDDGSVVAAIHKQNGSTARHKKVPGKAKIVLTDDQLDRFVGLYDYKTAVMRVTRKGSQLYAQLSGQPRFKIYPQTKTKFAWAVVEAEVEFVEDDNGKVVKGVHKQNGRTSEVPRIEETPSIEMSDEELDEYVGRYNYGLLAGKMEIKRNGNTLTAKLRGQPAMKIVPVAKDEFRWQDVNASIKFERDDQGKIKRGLHTQGGRTIKVPRVK